MKNTIKGTPCAIIHSIQNHSGHLKLIYENENNTDNINLESESVSINSPILCTHRIPLYISIPEFMAFISPVESYVSRYRTLREETKDTYMVLLQFKESQAANTFFKLYQNRPFSSLEPETCRIIYIQSIELSPARPLFALTQPEETCSVCLEPLDESKWAILTIFCQHAFHHHCLLKWRDGSCPVCRYSQKKSEPNEESSKVPAQDEERTLDSTDENKCAHCEVKENLWICLICGHVGCGRYHAAHAYHHFQQTDHIYALEIHSERVWDYASDGFVHRLVQNAADGKLVELPDQDPSQDQKAETVALEYSCMLTTQLDSQRVFYEDQTDQLSHKLATLVHRIKQVETQNKTLMKENERIDQLIKTKESQLTKDTTQKNRAQVNHDLALKNLEEVKLVCLKEKEITNNLVQDNQRLLKTSLLADQTISDLNDQIRDLLFFLEARRKVQTDPTLEGATVETRPSLSSRRKKGKRK